MIKKNRSECQSSRHVRVRGNFLWRFWSNLEELRPKKATFFHGSINVFLCSKHRVFSKRVLVFLTPKSADNIQQKSTKIDRYQWVPTDIYGYQIINRLNIDRHRQTSTDIHRHRQTSTDIDRHPQTSTDIHRHPQTSTEIDRHWQTLTDINWHENISKFARTWLW